MKVVINRTDAIGDLILTMPMAKLIKEKFPEAHIVFIISPRCEDLMIDHPYIDEYWVMDKNKNFFSKFSFCFHKFKQLKPDLYIHVGGSHVPTFTSWLIRTKKRGGLVSKWQSFVFLNKGVRQSRSIVNMHESDYNMALLRPFEIEYNHEKRSHYAPMINLKMNEVQKNMDEFKQKLITEGHDPNREMIFIHPGMTGHTLNWAARNYARLIIRMERKYPGRFLYVLSHTSADEKYMAPIRENLALPEYTNVLKNVYYFNGGDKGLRHYMGILSQATLFIGPSTGTTHIANALGVKQVGIYGPIKVQSAMRWGPFNRHSKVDLLIPEVVCGEQFNCAGNSCPYYECMAKIEVDDVVHSLENILQLTN